MWMFAYWNRRYEKEDKYTTGKRICTQHHYQCTILDVRKEITEGEHEKELIDSS